MLITRTTYPEMDLERIISQARKLAPKSNNRQSFLTELDEFELFMEEEAYDLDALKHDSAQIRDGYLAHSTTRKQATYVFNKIISIIKGKHSNKYSRAHSHSSSTNNYHNSLLSTQIYNKFDHFTNLVNFKKNRSAFVTQDSSYITVDKYIPNEFRFLKPLEKVSVKNCIPLGEYLVTGYHESGLHIAEYISHNELFHQLKQKYDINPNNRNLNIAHETMMNYLIEYEKRVAKPLSFFPNQTNNNNNQTKAIEKYNDNITIIINYMIEINNGIHKLLSEKTSYPVQFDVFFVAPDMHEDLNLHNITGLCDEIRSDTDSRRNGAVDAIADIYHLLRRAANNINKLNGQRFVMLIVRNNFQNTSNDTVYIYNASGMNAGCVPPKFVSDNVELTYLLNSKLYNIIPGRNINLHASDAGILGLTHHLHSEDCSKTYLSYAGYKSRIFKHNFLERLQLVFDANYISQNKRIDFDAYYHNFIDFGYSQIGEYWFNNRKAYECWEPFWNPQNCRAMGNVFISKNCTAGLKDYIDEIFESCEKLYYKLDYTIGMQIVDKQTIYIKFKNNNNDAENIVLINTELHRNGEILYAVIVENTFKSKQKWKIINFEHISQAFMTEEEIINKYKLFIIDLPKGSKSKHNHFTQLKNKINVTKNLIRSTNWSHIRIVQSKQQSNGQNSSAGTLKISERRFKQLALKSFLQHVNQNKALIPIAHFKFRKNKYHLEKLLPVYIPEHNKYVAISFWYNQLSGTGRVQASGVCLDLTDMKNKANLVQQIANDSWLNCVNEQMTINNLTIGQYDTPATFISGKNNSSNKKNGKKMNKQQKRNQQNVIQNNNNNRNIINAQNCVQNNNNNNQNTTTNTNTVPQLLQNISIGSSNASNNMSPNILPQLNMNSVNIMPSIIPSIIPQMQPMQNMSSISNVQTLQSMPQTLQSMPQASYPNTMQCSVPNIQQFVANAQYFNQFLPVNNMNMNQMNNNLNGYLNVNTETTSPIAVNCFYNNPYAYYNNQ